MNRIEDQANYYKNLHLRDRNIVAVVHVEDKTDEIFWNVQLQRVKSGFYHFVAQSRNEKGLEVKGCEQCLKYRPFVNRQFFICIDSDLRLLRGERGLTPDNYIAQTHAYSWENHACQAEQLQQRVIDKLGNCDFDFVCFLNELSHIVYRPLCCLIHCKTPDLNTVWNIGKFNKCIPLQPSSEELKNNGQLYLLKVRNLFDSELSSLELPVQISIDGLTQNNAYLHMQGHRLYDLVLNIGTKFCKGTRVAFKSEVLDTLFPTSGYSEIDNLQSDLDMPLPKFGVISHVREITFLSPSGGGRHAAGAA